jgi:hypothetical protein
MAINQSVLQRSQLGRLLVSRKLITESQLDEAVRLQQSSGARLGEILVEQGWVTQKQIAGALRKQTSIRLVALVVATLMMPFQTARASDVSTSVSDLYSPAQHELISNFEIQAAMPGNLNNPDLGDVAKVTQTGGEANLAVILQSGSHDLATIEQSGGNQNTAFINQGGSNQVAMIIQAGSRNTALINQR